MEAGNPSDQELWDVCRKLRTDWEPIGQRKWNGRREARPDCDSCVWFAELFHTSPDWGTCANPESERSGLLTFRAQGCWQHEPETKRRYQASRPARCDFMRGFERFLREQAADFIRETVRKANDPFPEDEPPAATPENIREAALVAVIRRLLRHADEDFRHPAFDAMASRARSDTRRYWEFARRYWARETGAEIPEIRLPNNWREVEEEFWNRVEAAISKAFDGRTASPEKR